MAKTTAKKVDKKAEKKAAKASAKVAPVAAKPAAVNKKPISSKEILAKASVCCIEPLNDHYVLIQDFEGQGKKGSEEG